MLRKLTERWVISAFGILTIVAVALAFSVPSNPTEQSNEPVRDATVVMDTQAAMIFSRSCADCHSNNTRWPWYSYVPPASWLVKRDVEEGREYFNVSSWFSYDLDRKREILADIARVVPNKEMPLPQYLLLHGNARLSDRDSEVLTKWAKQQRRCLKATEPRTSGSGLLN